MTDLERLHEAADDLDRLEELEPRPGRVGLADALRRMTNRVELDYEAAVEASLKAQVAIPPFANRVRIVTRIVDAAAGGRLLLANGERVEWCEVHGAPSWDGRDLFCMAGPGDSEERSCLMISRLLVDPPKEEER